MGFFSELKQDLSQAVNELVPEGEEFAEAEVTKSGEMEEIFSSKEEESVLPETSEELGKMVDNMDFDMMENTENILDKALDEILEDEMEELELEELKWDEPETEEPELEELEWEEPETDEPETGKSEMREEEVQVEETQYMGMETENYEMAEEVMDETAIITAGMMIKGDISSQGSLNVIGTIEGNIDIRGKLNITGTIDGASKAADVYAEKARINGDVTSSASIKIGQNTIVIGNIYATSAVIAGAVKGDIDVKGPVILDASAIVMGNIKSKSVQINNGAVIEGLCSQCYADVSPSSFFEDIKKARK
ncbi:MAG: polymer-forming cytoskeletal protein [Lachnospiraceae bacterium]|nr:polymer-forming cytoskeletal protein [Lachnospiraceae bacterium]